MYDPADEAPEMNSGTGMESSPFDNPYTPAPTPMEQGKAFFQQHGKKVIAGIALLALILFLYTFFIGSLVKVTIEARDTEGKLIGGAHGSIFEGSSENAFKTFNGSATLDLRPGDYRIEWQAPTPYTDPGTQPITVGGDGITEQTEKTIFEKNIGVTITSLTFPGTLVVGQTGAQAALTLENKSAKEQTIELAYDKDVGPALLEINTQPAVLTLPPNGSLVVNLSINVPANTTVKNTRTGDSKSGKIRVKFTNDGKTASYALFKTFNLDVTPKTPQSISASATKLVSKTFTLKNSNQTDAGEAVRVDVSVKNAQNNELSEIQSWFNWSPSEPFPILKKGESIPVQLQVLAPPTALSDTITGEIRFYTGFWAQTIPFTLTLTEAKVELKTTLDGSDTSKKYTLAKETSGAYEVRNALLKLDNQGALVIENVLMEANGCEQYISQVDPNFFLGLRLAEKGKSGSSKTTSLHITAPASALPGDTKTCLLQISFLDPKTSDVTQNDPITVQIET